MGEAHSTVYWFNLSYGQTDRQTDKHRHRLKPPSDYVRSGFIIQHSVMLSPRGQSGLGATILAGLGLEALASA